ncbi:DUF6457 domain-containing protein [Flaviflexus huanghaiensis]|uniref:DUF6457 domain-containing protein n=1 Tax=Flaviflexus huanghaiensis TaxID=1111473 RepID=UPI0015FA597A|nr:DUF6457 domain-containing protein [Flaviflexus huanghaiensis]
MARDTPEKMEAMRSWLSAVAEELNIAPEVMAEAEAPLLQLIGKIAYGPSRPGAPLTAFLIGMAVGQGEGESTALIAKIKALVDEYMKDRAPHQE